MLWLEYRAKAELLVKKLANLSRKTKKKVSLLYLKLLHVFQASKIYELLIVSAVSYLGSGQTSMIELFCEITLFHRYLTGL